MRQQLLTHLFQEIQNIRDYQRAGFMKGYQSNQLATIEESELFNPKDGESKGGVQPAAKQQEITDAQRLGLKNILDTDAKIVSNYYVSCFNRFVALTGMDKVNHLS